MKFKFLPFIAVAALIAFGCEPQDPEKNEENNKENNENNENNQNNNNQQQTITLDQAAQKAKLNEIGIKLLGYADLANWSDAFTTVAKFAKELDGDYDTDAFEHLRDAGVFGKSYLDQVQYNEYGWWCNYKTPGEVNNIHENTVQFSKINGKHVLDKASEAWVYTPASTFSMEAEVDGKVMTGTAAFTEDSNKLLFEHSHHEEIHNWEAYKTSPAAYGKEEYDEEQGYYHWKYETRENPDTYETEFHCYNPVTKEDLGWISERKLYSELSGSIDAPAGQFKTIYDYTTYGYMPKTLAAAFSDGTSKIADLNFNVKYTGATANIVDLSKDQFAISGTFEASGYALKSEHLDYLKDGAQVQYVLGRGNEAIITMNLTEHGFGVKREEINNKKTDGAAEGSTDTWTYSESYIDYQIETLPTSVEMTLDLVGMLQVAGNVDVSKLVELSGKIDQDRTDETKFKALVADAEKCFTLDVFYDGSKERSAFIGLEPFKKTGGDGKVYWDVNPVIRFADGSAYALFEAFFNENDFASLITAIGEYETKVGEFLSQFFGKSNNGSDDGQGIAK